MIRHVELPTTPADIVSWRVGDVIFLTGVVLTARDLAHRRILKAGLLETGEQGQALPFDPTGLPIFHCGPLARRDASGWTIMGLGPTTSARMEPSTPAIMARFKTPFLIGKGGMGPATRRALVEHGAAYLAAVGGTGPLKRFSGSTGSKRSECRTPCGLGGCATMAPSSSGWIPPAATCTMKWRGPQPSPWHRTRVECTA
ncbi:MAG: fumarate hydratase C-terminal domain-containing protein [Candidatus Bipolaricaulota bacterium]|nr:fumarate hydratase C-terminal domain-containing protein [Candidatus Bipolaricaulota bacterium]